MYAPWPVFVLTTQAACTTVAAATAIGVLGGGLLTGLISKMAVRKIAVALFGAGHIDVVRQDLGLG